jgi:nicotinamide mononucleotide transporter
MTGELSTALVIEILATTGNLIYIVFLIKEKIICWSFGIAGSALSVYLFLDAKLYSEALLYTFYALMGCWGWIRWHRRLEQDNNPVIKWNLSAHSRAIMLACAVALGLGYSAQYFTDAERPFFDAFTTAFSFMATYMEITKVLETWIYWIILNLASIWLYHDRDLDIYAVLIGFYSVLSVWGFISWNKVYRTQVSA